MHLFLVHCGFYDKEVGQGLYEGHTNFFVVAKDWQEARAKAKEAPIFTSKKMHIDGLQQIEAIDGYRVTVTSASDLKGKSVTTNYSYEDMQKLKAQN